MVSLIDTSVGPDRSDASPREPVAVDVVGSEPGPTPIPRVPDPFFTENRDQFGTWPPRFYAHGGPYSVALGDGWIAYDLHCEDGRANAGGTVVRTTFVGANDVVPEGLGTLELKNHYLRGSDPARWITDVPNHQRVLYRGLWDGIDLEFRFKGGELKYEFIVAPGSDPSRIVTAYEGMDSLGLCEGTDDLLVRAREATLRDHAPVTYQDVGGCRVPVPSAFRLLGGDRVTFRLGDYDPSLQVIIDPGMLFSTFLGESGDDVGHDVAVDEDGHAFVAGLTSSSKFPVTPGAYDASFSSSEAFVSRFSPNGSSLEYSTFIGGLLDEEAMGVAVDDDGCVYLIGMTESSDFPTTNGAFCTTRSGTSDAFALKLNVTGSSLEYSTYIGGGSTEVATGIGLDSNGSLYVAGWTRSSDFPEVDGSFRRTGTAVDVFVVKLRADGSDLEYSSVLGGDEPDYAYDLAIDDAGCAYLTGRTESKGYPITSGAYDTRFHSIKDEYPLLDETPDVFVTKLNVTGGSLVYSTFVGDIWEDWGRGIDVDGQGCAYVVGATRSGLFPDVPSDPYPSKRRMSLDSFIMKLSGAGDGILYSRAFRVSYGDEARAVSVDREGSAYVTGCVEGRGNFTTTHDAFQPQNCSGSTEAFVLKLDRYNDHVLYASYLGGDQEDYGNALALDRDGLLYVTGNTFSTNGFPTTPGAYDNTSDASTSGDPLGDAFLCKMDISLPVLVNDTSDRLATTGDIYTFNFTVADNAGVVEAGLEYWFSDNVTNNLSLDLSWGTGRNGTWTATIVIPSHSLAPLYYQAWAKDSSGLNATLTSWSVRVVDNDLPVLENLTPASGGTGNEINLSVRVVDNVNVSKVAALFWPGLGIDPGSDAWTMAESTTEERGGIYNFTVVLPWYSTDPFRYRFWANDTSNNWNVTDYFEVKVLDDDGPMMKVDPLPGKVTTGQALGLRVHVRDNIAVAGVCYLWWYDSGIDPTVVTRPMEAAWVDAGGNGSYTATFRIPFITAYPYVLPIGVVFKATDTSGNNVTSGTFLLDVSDDDPPWFLEDLSPGEATTGDPFDIRVRAWDNVALDRVWVRYWYGRGRAIDLSLGRGSDNVWNATITIPHAFVGLHYIFGAIDSSRNVNWSQQWDLQVVDNDAPEVVDDASDDVAMTGGSLTFKVLVVDNLFVGQVRVVYWMGDGERLEVELVGEDLSSGNNGTYRTTVDAPCNASGPLTYVIVATDGAGNVNRTEERHVDVRDDDRPWFGDDLSDGEAWRGERFHLAIEVWDNVAVDEVRCEWRFGDGEHLNETVPLGAPFAIDVPYDPEGPLRFLFAARDAAGNWNSTGTFQREVLNRPPTIVGLGVWNVTEEEREELDLREHIEDRDDVTWTLDLDSPDANVTLEGYSLRAYHEVQVPDYVIELSISDGRVTTWHNITVHVLGVNDPPRIHEVMLNGRPFDNLTEMATFREGRQDALIIRASDEEGDALDYSWQMDGVEVATGMELRYRDLPPGVYDLTLNLCDGTDTTCYGITVSVIEEAEPSSPWTWAVVVLLVVALVLVILLIRVTRGDSG